MENNMSNQSERTQIAVLQNQMETVLTGVDAINKKLDLQESKYVLVAVYEPRMLALENKVNSLIAKRWIQNTLSAILGSILTGLVGYFILNIGR